MGKISGIMVISFAKVRCAAYIDQPNSFVSIRVYLIYILKIAILSNLSGKEWNDLSQLLLYAKIIPIRY